VSDGGGHALADAGHASGPKQIYANSEEKLVKKNMGTADRIIRVLLAAVVVVLGATKVIAGTWLVVLGIVAAILVLTSIIGLCPLYLPFKISTRRQR
jgi:O-antigen/teichoic acid export membrane protein